MSVASNVEGDSLFHGGPPLRLEERLHICRHRDSRVLRRAALIGVIGWVPLMVLAAPQWDALIRIIGYSIRAFAPVGLAMGVVVAGSVAAIALAVFVMFCSPITVFASKLEQTWTRGVFQYGAIAAALGRGFEHEWLAGKRLPLVPVLPLSLPLDVSLQTLTRLLF